MSKSIKAVLVIGVLLAAAACAKEEEVVMVEPEPIMEEQTYSKF
jgi:hypothetical protein